MNIAWILLYALVINGLEIVIFFKVDGISLTFDRIFKAFLLKFLLGTIFTTFQFLAVSKYLSYFIEPLFGIGLSFLLLRGLPKKILTFLWSLPNDINRALLQRCFLFCASIFGARNCRWGWQSYLFIDYDIRLLHSFSLFEMVRL